MNRKDANSAKIAKFREPGAQVNRLARAVVDAAFEVYWHLGPGFLESLYEEALAHELASRGLPFERQVSLDVDYKGLCLRGGRVDLLVGSSLVVELKATENILPVHRAQLIAYLKAMRSPLGLLINFNSSRFADAIRRVVHTP